MASSAHDEFAMACGNHFGVGISFNRLRLALDTFHTRMLSGEIATFPIPSTKLAFTIKTRSKPQFKPRIAQNCVEFTNLVIAVVVHVAGAQSDVFTTITFSFPSIRAKPYVDSTRRLRLKRQDSTPDTPTVTGIPPSQLLKDYFAGEMQEYKYFEYMFRFNALQFIPDIAIESIPLPDILGSLGAFHLAPIVDVVLTDNYLILTGRQSSVAEASPSCPKGNNAEEEIGIKGLDITTSPIAPQYPSVQDGSGPVLEYKTKVMLAHNREPKGAAPWAGESSVIVYVPEFMLSRFASGAVKPGIPKHDHGSCVAYFEYFASLVLGKNGTDIRSANNQISIHTEELELFGKFSTGIEIGCVRIELLGEAITGGIYDLNIGFSPLIRNNQLMMDSYLLNEPRIEIKVQGGFPLGMILSSLVASIARWVIWAEITKFENGLRVQILDLSKLGIEVGPRTRAMQSVRDQSVLYGIVD